MKTKRLLLTLIIAISFIFTFSSPAVFAGSKHKKNIKKLYKGEKAYNNIAALLEFGPRVAATEAEREAAAYIATKMASYGIQVEIEEFPTLYYEEFSIEANVVDGEVLSPNFFTFSPAGEVTAPIVHCGLGNPDEFPPEVAGNIALIQRGELTFYDKTQNAAAAGAEAVIIYNHSEGNIQGTLGDITDIPAAALSLAEGELLVELLDGGKVVVHLNVDSDYYMSTSQNVIGTITGKHPDYGVMYMGAHYDSVPGAPGANDDGSGVGAMMEAARIFSKKGLKTKATLKFIAFGAEETGLNGSEQYVIAHQEEVETQGIGMINLDMIAVGDVLKIGCIGVADMDLTEYTQIKADRMGIEDWVPFEAAQNSDHTYFELAGLPVVFLAADPDLNYHTPEDSLDKIDLELLEQNGELASAVMYDWAKYPHRPKKKAVGFKKVHAFRDKVKRTK